jgi:HEAT repeat protein
VVFGEQGNGGGKPELIPQGIGGVWDPGSARRMRVRTWTAFFNEISFVFWETSYAKDGHHMNLWIGPEERQYIHALQDFAYRLDAGIRPVAVPLGGPQAQQVRSYGLRSDRRAAVYLHHTTCQQCAVAASGDKSAHHTWDHQRGAVQDLQVTIDVPQAGHGYWYRPTDAAVLARFDAAAGSGTFTVPDFDVDLALLITPDGPPDIDHDGQPNDGDEDDDNDGCPDAQDAYPLEREEQADVDQDRIGDSLDADIDGDGVADDRNGNGIPDNEEPDWDGDGVPNAGAIPWDAFPRDPKELRDTDGDGIGDNADPDDDGDGYTDEEERRAGTDPLNPLSFPTQPLEQWIQALYDNDPRFREQAARALGQLGAGAATAVAPLTQTLADPVAPVRAAAAESLGKIGPAAKPAVAPLLAALKDRTPIRLDAHVAMVASEALGDLGPGVLPELMAALDSPDLLTCLGSAAALQRMGPQAQEAIPRLIALLASDPNRRIPMIAALQGIGKAAKPAVPALIKTLDSEDFHTQYWACRALGAIGPDAQAAVPKLCELTKSGTASVRRNAAAALGQIGPAIGTAGLDALIAAVGDGIEPVRENAVKALGQLADFAAPAVPTIRAAVAERKIAARVASARALWRITHDADTAVPILIEQLGGLDEPEDAAEALAELGPAAQAAVPALVARLTAQAGSLRALACEALGKIGTAAQPAIPELQKLREDEDAEVRQAADEALVQIRSAVGRINTRGP